MSLLILGCGFEQLVDQNIALGEEKWCGAVKCGHSKVVDERTTTQAWWWPKHSRLVLDPKTHDPKTDKPFPPFEKAIVE